MIISSPLERVHISRQCFFEINTTIFKNKLVFVSTCLSNGRARGTRLSKAAESVASSLARHALGPGNYVHFKAPILTAVAVPVTVLNMLTQAKEGDSVIFLCRSQLVHSELRAALNILIAD